MAFDIEAIRKKLGQLSGANSKRNSFWRPPENEESIVRFLSFPNNNGQPFKELYFYYNIGSNPGLLAPFQFGSADPFQELITKLRDEGTKESYEMAKQLYPKMRCYAPVIVRGEEDKGVRLWNFGKMVYEELLGLMLDEDYGDITDPSTGRDIKIKCTKQPSEKWAKTSLTPRGSQSPLHKDAKQVQEWVASIPDPNDFYEAKSYEQLEKIINDWLRGDAGNDDDDDEGTSRGGGATDDFSAKLKNLDDVFSDLSAD